MSERWRRMVELLDVGWAAMSEADKDLYQAWLIDARPHDLYHLLRHVRRGGRASSTQMAPVKRAPEED